VLICCWLWWNSLWLKSFVISNHFVICNQVIKTIHTLIVLERMPIVKRIRTCLRQLRIVLKTKSDWNLLLLLYWLELSPFRYLILVHLEHRPIPFEFLLDITPFLEVYFSARPWARATQVNFFLIRVFISHAKKNLRFRIVESCCYIM